MSFMFYAPRRTKSSVPLGLCPGIRRKSKQLFNGTDLRTLVTPYIIRNFSVNTECRTRMRAGLPYVQKGV